MRPWIIVIALVLVAAIVFYYRSHPLTAKVRIAGHLFAVDVAVTSIEKMKGLGGRVSMPDNYGMLFVYDHKEGFNFWMRGMQFPLDFIWIDGKKVADITTDVPPPKSVLDMPVIVKPKTEVDKVLELNAGTAQKLGVKIGDVVEFLDR